MKSKILNVAGSAIISKKEQMQIKGGGGTPDLSVCGCDCAGGVTGPFYCFKYIACPQVYTCEETY